jgi:hypothetical protein
MEKVVMPLNSFLDMYPGVAQLITLKMKESIEQFEIVSRVQYKGWTCGYRIRVLKIHGVWIIMNQDVEISPIFEAPPAEEQDDICYY